MNAWNSLPDCVVDTDNLDKIKTRIDKFWQQQKVLEPETIADLDLEIRT